MSQVMPAKIFYPCFLLCSVEGSLDITEGFAVWIGKRSPFLNPVKIAPLMRLAKYGGKAVFVL